jgi:hypothetical protein
MRIGEGNAASIVKVALSFSSSSSSSLVEINSAARVALQADRE